MPSGPGETRSSSVSTSETTPCRPHLACHLAACPLSVPSRYDSTPHSSVRVSLDSGMTNNTLVPGSNSRNTTLNSTNPRSGCPPQGAPTVDLARSPRILQHSSHARNGICGIAESPSKGLDHSDSGRSSGKPAAGLGRAGSLAARSGPKPPVPTFTDAPSVDFDARNLVSGNADTGTKAVDFGGSIHSKRKSDAGVGRDARSQPASARAPSSHRCGCPRRAVLG